MDLRGIWSEQESRENIFAKNPPSLTSFEIPDSLLEEIQFELKSTLNGQSVAEECETNCFHRHHHNQYHHHHCHHHHRHHHHHATSPCNLINLLKFLKEDQIQRPHRLVRIISTFTESIQFDILSCWKRCIRCMLIILELKYFQCTVGD